MIKLQISNNAAEIMIYSLKSTGSFSIALYFFSSVMSMMGLLFFFIAAYMCYSNMVAMYCRVRMLEGVQMEKSLEEIAILRQTLLCVSYHYMTHLYSSIGRSFYKHLSDASTSESPAAGVEPKKRIVAKIRTT